MSIYLFLPGAHGSVTEETHRDWIDVHDLEFSGISHPISCQLGQRYNRIGTAPTFGSIHLVKPVDPSTPVIIQYTTQGKVFPDPVRLAFVTTGKPSEVYLEYALEDVMIAQYSHRSNHKHPYPMEEITLVYQTLQITYIDRTRSESGSPIRFGYDLAQAVSL